MPSTASSLRCRKSIHWPNSVVTQKILSIFMPFFRSLSIWKCHSAIVVIFSMSSLSPCLHEIVPVRPWACFIYTMRCFRLHFILRLQRQPICLRTKKILCTINLLAFLLLSLSCCFLWLPSGDWRLLLRFRWAFSMWTKSFIRSIIRLGITQRATFTRKSMVFRSRLFGIVQNLNLFQWNRILKKSRRRRKKNGRRKKRQASKKMDALFYLCNHFEYGRITEATTNGWTEKKIYLKA